MLEDILEKFPIELLLKFLEEFLIERFIADDILCYGVDYLLHEYTKIESSDHLAQLQCCNNFIYYIENDHL